MPLAALLGSVVGLSLGLTGGGGAIFAVPLLVYGLGMTARDAASVSLLTVGTTALVGFLQRAWRGLVEFPTGLLFALAGMSGAPLGVWLANRLSDSVLIGLFAILMLVIAASMWRNADDSMIQLAIVGDENSRPTCQRDSAGELRLTSRCALLLGLVGFGTGVLAGLFGVGGGFIIVPALVMFSRMGMQRAIGTSLLVITLVSAMGLITHLLAGKQLFLSTAGVFTGGSIAGLFAGSWLSQRMAGPALHKVFALAIVAVAIFVISRTLFA